MDVVVSFEGFFKIHPNPETWLNQKRIMKIIREDKVYKGNAYDWLLQKSVIEGKLVLSLALQEVCHFVDYACQSTKISCFGIIRNALDECKSFEEKRCAIFWIAFFTIIHGISNGKIRIEEG